MRTGGIGSGKSLAADHFAAKGITVVDADALSRQLTAPGGAALAGAAPQWRGNLDDRVALARKCRQRRGREAAGGRLPL